MCFCLLSGMQPEDDADPLHKRVPEAVGGPVETWHPASHVRRRTQNREQRHAGPGSIPLPGLSLIIMCTQTIATLSEPQSRILLLQFRAKASNILTLEPIPCSSTNQLYV